MADKESGRRVIRRKVKSVHNFCAGGSVSREAGKNINRTRVPGGRIKKSGLKNRPKNSEAGPIYSYFIFSRIICTRFLLSLQPISKLMCLSMSIQLKKKEKFRQISTGFRQISQKIQIQNSNLNIPDIPRIQVEPSHTRTWKMPHGG